MEKQVAINYLVKKKNEILSCEDPDVWKASIINELPNLFPISGIEKRQWFEDNIFDSYIADFDQELFPKWERKQAHDYIQNYIDEIEMNDMESKKSQAKNGGKISELIHNEFFYAAIVCIGGLCFFLGTFYEKLNHSQMEYTKPEKTEMIQEHQ